MKVVVQIHVTPSSMFRGKMARATKPVQMLVNLLAIVALSVGCFLLWDWPLPTTLLAIGVGVIALRLFTMSISSVLGARSPRLNGSLVFTEEGLQLRSGAHTAESHPWSWLLNVEELEGELVLQLAERGGRVFVFVGSALLEARGEMDALRTLLVNAGKLKQ